jgi:hypothetical protein
MSDGIKALWGIVAFLYVFTIAVYFIDKRYSKKDGKTKLRKKRMKMKSLKYRRK